MVSYFDIPVGLRRVWMKYPIQYTVRDSSRPTLNNKHVRVQFGNSLRCVFPLCVKNTIVRNLRIANSQLRV
jgi:hypothetical protein